MVWFECQCGDTIKKPKVQAHLQRCHAQYLTCVDCSQDFSRYDVQKHSQCVSEVDKYANGVLKPGYVGTAALAAEPLSKKPGQPVGLEHCSLQYPYKCRLCNVVCTSKEIVLSHAAGAKHSRRARASAQAQTDQGPAAAVTSDGTATAAAAPAPDTEAHAVAAVPADPPGPSGAANGLPVTETAAVQQRPKWKHMAKKHLQANAGRMKISKLKKSLLAPLASLSDAGLEQSMLRTLTKSSQFDVQQTYISLRNQV